MRPDFPVLVAHLWKVLYWFWVLKLGPYFYLHMDDDVVMLRMLNSVFLGLHKKCYFCTNGWQVFLPRPCYNSVPRLFKSQWHIACKFVPCGIDGNEKTHNSILVMKYGPSVAFPFSTVLEHKMWWITHVFPHCYGDATVLIQMRVRLSS